MQTAQLGLPGKLSVFNVGLVAAGLVVVGEIARRRAGLFSRKGFFARVIVIVRRVGLGYKDCVQIKLCCRNRGGVGLDKLAALVYGTALPANPRGPVRVCPGFPDKLTEWEGISAQNSVATAKNSAILIRIGRMGKSENYAQTASCRLDWQAYFCFLLSEICV